MVFSHYLSAWVYTWRRGIPATAIRKVGGGIRALWEVSEESLTLTEESEYHAMLDYSIGG